MKREQIKQEVSSILENYLVSNSCRCTPERFAILDAICDQNAPFQIEQLASLLEERSFRVSRATLYNSMRLFIKLRIVVRHRFLGCTTYEVAYKNDSHIQQVCTSCGKVVEIKDLALNNAVTSVKTPRFRKDGFSLYIYGICARCQRLETINRNKKL